MTGASVHCPLGRRATGGVALSAFGYKAELRVKAQTTGYEYTR
jgi:hypothetical protein